jgi:hypothetical protein
VAACDRNTGQCSPAPPTSLCVPGGGKLATDCAAEWVVDNPGNPGGPNSRIQICRQGDPRCDFDGDPRQCTFHVRVCLNSHDANLIRLANCEPGQVSTYQLRSPGPRSSNGQALLDAIGALAPSSRSGKRRNRVSFNPPDAAADHCTAPVPVVVPVGAVALKVRATSPAGPPDKDKLRLKCTR